MSKSKNKSNMLMAVVMTYLYTSLTDPPMYNIASVVTCSSITIVRSLPLPGVKTRYTTESDTFFNKIVINNET